MHKHTSEARELFVNSYLLSGLSTPIEDERLEQADCPEVRPEGQLASHELSGSYSVSLCRQGSAIPGEPIDATS